MEHTALITNEAVVFGLLMAIGMISALAGDLLGLPPLLIRERGRRFPKS